MKTRGLADFRAEYNIWRKDLAEQLGLREAELERLELTGEVPEAILQALTAEYQLPQDYFTEDVERAAVLAAAAERYEPKTPLAYFFKTAFLWYLFLGVVMYAVTLPSTIAVFFSYEISGSFILLENICIQIINIVSGIYLGSHILKKTNFRGSIAAYEFLYPYLPGMAVAGIYSILSLVFRTTPNALPNLFAYADVFSVVKPQLLTLLFSAVFVVLSIVYLAFLLDTAARAQGAEKEKRLKILCGIALGSQVLSYIAQMVGGNFFTADALTWTVRVLSFLLLLAVLYGVLFGAQKSPRSNTLWLTVLPIVAMALPMVVSCIRQFLK